MKKNNVTKPLIFLIFELICFAITQLALHHYHFEKIYSHTTIFLQIIYTLPILLILFYTLLSKSCFKKQLIHTTIFLICYSLFLHFGIEKIISKLTASSGITNFAKYASKIYFIALPLLGFQIISILEKSNKKLFLLLILRTLFLGITTFFFQTLFQLNGILYSWSLNEFLFFLYLLANKKTPFLK